MSYAKTTTESPYHALSRPITPMILCNHLRDVYSVLPSPFADRLPGAGIRHGRELRKSDSKGKSGSKGKGKGSSKTKTLEIAITNLTPFQPFSPFFVMTHDASVPRLFSFGQPATPGLRELAENGNPASLVAMYAGMPGVATAAGTTAGATGPGATQTITVEVSEDYPYVTLGSMFVNTNDGFIAINGRYLEDGDAFFLIGYDAGTEENNQNCNSIPGPACPPGNAVDGNGEGFVHVHAGYQSDIGGDLPNVVDEIVDWRNPMAYVVVTEV